MPPARGADLPDQSARAAIDPASVESCAGFVRARLNIAPTAAIILGSGLDAIGGAVQGGVTIDYRSIPGFPVPTIAGHAGRLTAGWLGATPVLVFRGRPHLYEGHHPSVLGLPVRLAQALGCRTIVVTNAAGGLRPHLLTGDLMLIADQIGLAGLAGAHPLTGWPVDDDARRFVTMVDAYDPALRALARQVANESGIRLHEGVYLMVAGPTYETPAESRLLALLGADAVGMSTVPEVQVARHLGMRTLGFSCITNAVAASSADSHQSVVDVAARAAGDLERLIWQTLERTPASDAKAP